MEVPADAPNKDTPTALVVGRWSVVAMLLAFAVVYLTMLITGFGHDDAMWLAGLSIIPLAIAILVGMLVWQFYWTPRSK